MQKIMDSIAIQIADLNDSYDALFKRLARHNQFGILPHNLFNEAINIKDTIADLAMVAPNWRDIAESNGVTINDDRHRLSDRAGIVRITGRMPKENVLKELNDAFEAMYAVLQANEEMTVKIVFDFKPLGGDDDT